MPYSLHPSPFTPQIQSSPLHHGVQLVEAIRASVAPSPVQPATEMMPFGLELLDFEYEPPCEHSQHEVVHAPSQSASWVISVRCPGCGGSSTYLICDSGLAAFFSGRQRHPECGFASYTPGVFIVSTHSLGGAS